MSNDNYIKQVKISDYLQIDFKSQTERLMLRLTGNVDKQKSTSDELNLYSIEENTKYEVPIDISYLNDFNLNDIHSQHDLVHLIGYKDPTSQSENSFRFRALSFRLIKRTSIKNYYLSIDAQNNYFLKKI